MISDTVDATRIRKSSLPPPSDEHNPFPTFDMDLPPELWLRVFHLLTYIPGVLELSDSHAIEAYSEDNHGIILRGLYDESMELKLMISMVSWTWRRLVLPLMYEYVMIRSAQHAQVVANALVHFKLQQDEDQYYGRWIKRVEIVLHKNYWEQNSVDALTSVLRHSPNIWVFSDFFSLGRLPEYATQGIVKALHELCEHGRLRRIESCGALVSQLHVLLSGTPSLEVLITKQQLSLHPVNLPNLRTLVIGESGTTYANELENMKAPNLHSLILQNDAVHFLSGCYTTRISGLYPKLRHLRYRRVLDTESLMDIANIPGLTSLTLDFGNRPILEGLEKFRIKLQNLQRLVLVRFPTSIVSRSDSFLGKFEKQQRFISEFPHPLLKTEDSPSLRTLGVILPRGYFEAGDFTSALNSRGPTSNIRVWDNFLAECRSRGVHVEASVGASDHFWGTWQPFHLGLIPHKRQC